MPQEKQEQETVWPASATSEDYWAGEDQAWDDYQAHERTSVLRFWRGLLLAAVVGALMWLLIGLAIYHFIL